jgi:heme/copper-type cytochrome/quinol oxidase subunit 3
LTFGNLGNMKNDTPSDSVTRPEDERGAFGMRLFILSLSVLFAASMVGYAVIRTRSDETVSVHLPSSLWWSTLFMIFSGIAIMRATRAAQAGQTVASRNGLLTGFVLSLVFLAIQVPSVAAILAEHAAMRSERFYLYGFALALIVLHAIHVLGGLIPLAVVTIRSVLDPGHYHPYFFGPIRYVSMYWHFLEIVWIIMFAMLLILG